VRAEHLRGDAKVLEEGGRLVVVVAAEQTRELGKRHGRTALPPGVVERANGHRADAPVATDELGHGAGLDVRRRAEQPKEGREVGRTPRHQHLARGGDSEERRRGEEEGEVSGGKVRLGGKRGRAWGAACEMRKTT